MRENKAILINASNLHSGGGIQVATSFISELLTFEGEVPEFKVWVSTEVADSLISVGVDVRSESKVDVINVYGINAFFSSENKKLSSFDLVFTLFGPNYFRRKGYVDLVGFAQLWILDNSAYKVLSFFNALKYKVKFFLQELFFKASDALVVELEHVRDGLIGKGVASHDFIHVAYNAISSLYFKSEVWQSLCLDVTSSNFKVGFLGRDYCHKNTAILPDVKRILAEKHSLDVDFFVTFNEGEWEVKSESFKSSVFNVGSLTLTQCPSFYNSLDAVIFPSLLECFSATPLEAMVMKKPLFASDRRFVKDVCGDFAFYFDPFKPESAADVIADYIFTYHGRDSSRLAKARDYAVNFSSPKGRAKRYIEIIKAELSNKSDRKS